MRSISPQNLLLQFRLTIIKHVEAIQFIRDHKLWVGAGNYGWVAKFLIVVGLILSLKFFTIFQEWLSKAKGGSPMAVMSSMGSLAQDMALKGYQMFSGGSMKYVVLILLEVLIFHFCRRTLEIKTGRRSDPSLKAFIDAQVRMFKVNIRSFILEKVIVALIGVALGIIFFTKFLTGPATFFIQCYFIGFAIFDNYTEQFHLSIKESSKLSLQYLGVVLAIGLVLFVVMHIPIVGTLLGPIVGAVTLTLAMLEVSDLHLRPVIEPAEPSLPAKE